MTKVCLARSRVVVIASKFIRRSFVTLGEVVEEEALNGTALSGGGKERRKEARRIGARRPAHDSFSSECRRAARAFRQVCRLPSIQNAAFFSFSAVREPSAANRLLLRKAFYRYVLPLLLSLFLSPPLLMRTRFIQVLRMIVPAELSGERVKSDGVGICGAACTFTV